MGDRYTEQEKEVVVSGYEQKIRPRFIAKELRRSVVGIRSLAQRMELKLRDGFCFDCGVQVEKNRMRCDGCAYEEHKRIAREWYRRKAKEMSRW